MKFLLWFKRDTWILAVQRFDGEKTDKGERSQRGAKRTYFYKDSPQKVTAVVGQTVVLLCRVKNLGNRTVSFTFLWIVVSLCTLRNYVTDFRNNNERNLNKTTLFYYNTFSWILMRSRYATYDYCAWYISIHIVYGNYIIFHNYIFYIHCIIIRSESFQKLILLILLRIGELRSHVIRNG